MSRDEHVPAQLFRVGADDFLKLARSAREAREAEARREANTNLIDGAGTVGLCNRLECVDVGTSVFQCRLRGGKRLNILRLTISKSKADGRRRW